MIVCILTNLNGRLFIIYLKKKYNILKLVCITSFQVYKLKLDFCKYIHTNPTRTLEHKLHKDQI